MKRQSTADVSNSHGCFVLQAQDVLGASLKCEMSWDLLLVKNLSAKGKRLVCFSHLCALPEVPFENKNWPFRVHSAHSCTVHMSGRDAAWSKAEQETKRNVQDMVNQEHT